MSRKHTEKFRICFEHRLAWTMHESEHAMCPEILHDPFMNRCQADLRLTQRN